MRKEWRGFTSIRWILDKEFRVLEETRVGGRENKDNLGRMEETPIRKLRIDLADVEMIGST